jgi:hypothetical protein
MPEKAANRDDVVAGHIRSDSEGDAFLNGALPCLIDGAELHRQRSTRLCSSAPDGRMCRSPQTLTRLVGSTAGIPVAVNKE